MSLISGIDIGTGAVCVYPLLFANMYRCKMIGTEIDSDSHESALLNIKRNNFEKLINVIRVDKGTVLRDVLPENNVCYTFTMCNPPFFDTEETMACKLKGTRLPPRNAPSGSKVELVVDGGETQFVSKMLEDSIELKDRIKIYTTMLGKKSSLIFLQNELKKLHVENSTWTEFCQGRTTRWGLAWTFLPKDQIDLTTAPVIRTSGARTQLKHKAKKAPSEIVFPAHSDITKAEELVAALKFWIQKLKIRIDELPINEQKSNCWGCQLMANEDTWSHERRKRRMMANQNSPSKRPRLNVSVEESCEKESESSISINGGSVQSITGSFLLCNLVAGEVETDDKEQRLKISMEFESGSGGKNALETLRQYFINKLNLREFMKGRSSDKKDQKRQRVRKKKKLLNNLLHCDNTTCTEKL
ncbi:RNA N6-adenosine-methyltransferase mettl16 isoform X2 [Athalia rosae]|nr:RNA N6-adenosine-methyltransferase mettl16 isoform X2 [Athalia rosae]